MVSRILRRSGVAILQFAEWLKWEPQLVLQVGIGHYHQEVDCMKECWPNVKFIGFEPHPQIYKNVVKTYPGDLRQLALSNRTGTAILHGKNRHKDGSSLMKHYEDGIDDTFDEFTVGVSTLDELFPTGLHGMERILLWLDCEGSELDVLKGGEDFINRVDVLNVEVTSKPPGDGWCRPTDIHRWLNEHGMLRVWHHTQRTCAGQCDAIYSTLELFNPEYCCCPCQQDMYEQMKENE